MTQTTSIHRKLDIRRAVTSSAFVMILLVAVMGLFALFSIWSINRAWTDGMNRSNELRTLSTAALEAQVAFKVQVQEWKNILLRGDDPALFSRYHEAFAKEGASVQALLGRVRDQAALIGFPDHAGQADEISKAHGDLSRSYQQTLSSVESSAGTLSADAARSIDRKLRGADRALEDRIGQLAKDIAHAAEDKRMALVSGMNARYETLRWFIVGVILLAVLVTAFMLHGILRATRT